ncbi:MAG: hypothetical protein HYU36_22215 [Planctomycetes bacterium]|nr:hypothetical protein [Planctomycetota bacterium]
MSLKSLSFFATLGWVARIGLGQAEDGQGKQLVYLGSDKPEYAIGEEIRLFVMIENQSNETVHLSSLENNDRDGIANAFFLVRASRGQSVLNTNVRRFHVYPNINYIGPGSIPDFRFRPGEKRICEYTLNEWYFLRETDVYEVQGTFESYTTLNSWGESYYPPITFRQHGKIVGGTQRTPPHLKGTSNCITITVSAPPPSWSETIDTWVKDCLGQDVSVKQKMWSLRRLAYTYDARALDVLKTIASSGGTDRAPQELKVEAERWLPRYEKLRKELEAEKEAQKP